MELKTLATKLQQEDFTRFKYICDKKGIVPSAYIRELILLELNNPMQQFVAGRNVFEYSANNDLFSWCIETDSSDTRCVIENLSAEFLKDLRDSITNGLERRAALIGQTNDESIAISEKFVRNNR